MAKALHVVDYLWDPDTYAVKPVCVLFGDESFLKSLAFRSIRDRVLDQEDAEFSLTRFEGSSANWSRVLEEVSTTAMFGGGKRLVVVEDCDSFITKNRDRLETYCEKPAKSGVLLLLVATFPATTKLYKKILADGMLIDCSHPLEKDVPAWIVRWAQFRHNITVAPNAADLLISLVGTELGLIDQELAKLTLYVPPKGKIDAALVESSVGTWRTRTTFEMLDLALAGKTAEALRQLNNLFLSGEHPVGILAQISYTLRKLGAATHVILEAEKRRSRISVASALNHVGVKAFFVKRMESQLIQLGRFRGAKMSELLLQADLDLKGASRIEPRLVLEKLIVTLADARLKQPSVHGNPQRSETK